MIIGSGVPCRLWRTVALPATIKLGAAVHIFSQARGKHHQQQKPVRPPIKASTAVVQPPAHSSKIECRRSVGASPPPRGNLSDSVCSPYPIDIFLAVGYVLHEYKLITDLERYRIIKLKHCQ